MKLVIEIKENACNKEQEYIAKFNSTDPDIGFNISKGGILVFKGLKHTDEYKKHMSEISKGKVFSESTLKKLKESHKKECKAVDQYSLDGLFIKSYNSLGDAANAVNGYRTNINRACSNNKQYKGFMWKLKGVM